MIPDEAVEAAARALAQPAPYDFNAYPQHWMKRARAALEAAAPHMIRQAQADAWDEAIDWTPEHRPANPYRKATNGDD